MAEQKRFKLKDLTLSEVKDMITRAHDRGEAYKVWVDGDTEDVVFEPDGAGSDGTDFKF